MGMLKTNNIYERLSHCNAVVAIKWQKVVQIGTLHDMYNIHAVQIPNISLSKLIYLWSIAPQKRNLLLLPTDNPSCLKLYKCKYLY